MALKFRLRRRSAAGEMTVIEHLEELRHRVFVCVGAIMVAGFGAWFLFGPVFRFLTNPFCDFMTAHPQLAMNRASPCDLAYLSIVDPFLVKIKTTAALAFLIALPVVMYQFWRFVTPGLLERERRFAIPFVLTSVVLFALGVWFALLTLPKGLEFLLGFAGTARITAVITMDRYLGFVTLLSLAFGASFEFPLVLISLTLAGVLSSRQLRHWRRNAILFIAIFAAVITPSQDWFTMTAMMLPLIVFYELSIIVARLLKK